MADPKNPDPEKFFTDPRFQDDRDFFRALHERYTREGLDSAMQRRKDGAPQGHKPNVFDSIAGLFGASDDGSDNVFDRYFGGRKK